MGALSPSALARRIWDIKYRDRAQDHDLADTWRRVARAVAAAEPEAERGVMAERFEALLAGGRFIPGGRIIAAAGTGRRSTWLNCFVMGPIDDSLAGIGTALSESMQTLQLGGGVGCDFSTLRPRGAAARSSGGVASGPVSFMRIWDAACAELLHTSPRGGALMATLRCDHPDVEAFIEAKRHGDTLRSFNLSVLISDAFLAAVAADAPWTLAFAGTPARVVPARKLWRRLADAAAACGDPGVLFVDRINHDNNLGYCETISATNPCGELPLPPYGACNLGSIDLGALVRAPFSPDAALDAAALDEAVALAARFLDDVLDASPFPLPVQRDTALLTRRIGLGVTGLADALCMLGLPYGDERARRVAADAMRAIAHAAYRASVTLAAAKGRFAAFAPAYLDAPFVRRLPADLRADIARHGVRNGAMLAIAPAGSISLLAGNASSGIEPIFRAEHHRRVHLGAGAFEHLDLVNRAVWRWRAAHPDATSRPPALPPAFVDAAGVSPRDQIMMQVAVQEHVDGAIAKTVALPTGAAAPDVQALFALAHEQGLKGLTVFPTSSPAGAVLTDHTNYGDQGAAESPPGERCAACGV